jgi:hypothetical protein
MLVQFFFRRGSAVLLYVETPNRVIELIFLVSFLFQGFCLDLSTAPTFVLLDVVGLKPFHQIRNRPSDYRRTPR